ncbi:ROK family protein [Streptomyces sp. TRM66268-LWL]|uniref:ROK family protein n=1 Tax=Streptomyces polyasparticus TaxID=2767826 RepID=A0ABR7S7N4_9ACTN|nr:ROK family protein [Streptomyces polyasparticus]MBC9711481.1 ROK family protein [Streptomyces polyasparticus]
MYAALDIGGTKIAGALVDEEGRVVRRVQHPTPARESARVLMGAVDAVLDGLAKEPGWSGIHGLGIASAGPVNTAQGTVSPVNIPAWRDFPLVAEVRSYPSLLAGIEPVLVGDAVAMTAAEHWRGAARDVDHALCMVVSTGVGGGLVLNGRLHQGRSGNAGHIGHISVDLDGAPCPCGGRGCVEGLASGTAIARQAVAAGWVRPRGEEATAAAVAAAATQGDPAALGAFDRAAQALAAAIAATATLVEIEAVVIGGGVAQAGDVLFAPLRRHLDSYATLDFVRGLRVGPAALAQDAGLVGAAAAARASAGRAAAARTSAGRSAAGVRVRG